MTVRAVLKYPDPRLREVATPVAAVTNEIRTLVDDMAETMYAENGCGLAATQIGVMQRIFVVDTASEDEPSNLMVFINPEIVVAEGSQVWEEGCLSFPGISEEIKRAERVKVRALDRNGNPFEIEAEGLLAVALQHETDHLNGVTMLDKVSAIKRKVLGRKLARQRAEMVI
jgi:peptide deformylase